jgi:hypothetical protein
VAAAWRGVHAKNGGGVAVQAMSFDGQMGSAGSERARSSPWGRPVEKDRISFFILRNYFLCK